MAIIRAIAEAANTFGLFCVRRKMKFLYSIALAGFAVLGARTADAQTPFYNVYEIPAGFGGDWGAGADPMSECFLDSSGYPAVWITGFNAAPVRCKVVLDPTAANGYRATKESLKLPKGSIGATGLAVNRSGQVAGISWSKSGTHQITYWASDGTAKGFGNYQEGVAINDFGKMLARYTVSKGQTSTYYTGIWNISTGHWELRQPGSASHMSDDGWVTASGGLSAPNGAFYSLASYFPGYQNIQAMGISPHGKYLSGSANDHAVLTTDNDGDHLPDRLDDIHPVGDIQAFGMSYSRSYSIDVNNSGAAIGFCRGAATTPQTLALMWDANGAHVLNDLCQTSTILTEAKGINEAGWITCSGTKPDGSGAYFLLVP
jgi:hypothetical protein